MQLQVQALGEPCVFVRVGAFEVVAELFEERFGFCVVFGADQDVCVAHEAVFRFWIHWFEDGAFEGHVVDAVLVEGSEYFVDGCHLVFAVEHLLQVDLEHLLHDRVVFWDAAQDCAGVGQRGDLVAADFLAGFGDVEVWREWRCVVLVGCIGLCAYARTCAVLLVWTWCLAGQGSLYQY